MSCFILSPCLLKNKDEEYCSCMEILDKFASTIEFIKDNLNLQMLVHNDSIYLNLYAYVPPLSNVNLANFFQVKIAKNLKELLNSGVIVFDDSNYQWELDMSYISVDDKESMLMYTCISSITEDVIMFVGCENSGCSDTISFTKDNRKYDVGVVKDVCMDMTGNFDAYIKFAFNTKDIFPNKHICSSLLRELPQRRDRACYLKYGELIAKRNGYIKLSHDPRWFKSNAVHFARMDDKFAIVIDDVHGTYEVFNNANKDFIGEYGFDGEEIRNKKSNPETHRYYG